MTNLDPNGKAPGATNTESFQTDTIKADCPTALLPSKALLKAHFAEAGYLVHDVDDGYIVLRADWGLSRHCESLAGLQAFARKLGVNHG